MVSLLDEYMAINDVDPAHLEHYGVKGMKWGVRKKDRSSSASPDSEARSQGTVDLTKRQPLTRNQKLAMVGGAVAAGLIVAGAVYAAKNGNIPLSDLVKKARPMSRGKSVADKAANLPADPSQVIYVARPRNSGYEWVQGGKEPRALSIMEEGLKRAGVVDDYGTTDQTEGFAKFGANAQVVAARFLDPEGRLDGSGRRQIHDLIIPASQSEGINNLDDVKRLAWPALAGTYQKVYDGVTTTADHELKVNASEQLRKIQRS